MQKKVPIFYNQSAERSTGFCGLSGFIPVFQHLRFMGPFAGIHLFSADIDCRVCATGRIVETVQLCLFPEGRVVNHVLALVVPGAEDSRLPVNLDICGDLDSIIQQKFG